MSSCWVHLSSMTVVFDPTTSSWKAQIHTMKWPVTCYTHVIAISTLLTCPGLLHCHCLVCETPSCSELCQQAAERSSFSVAQPCMRQKHACWMNTYYQQCLKCSHVFTYSCLTWCEGHHLLHPSPSMHLKTHSL